MTIYSFYLLTNHSTMTETQPTREEKIAKIYEVIARKDLTFGCIVYVPEIKNGWYSKWVYVGWETDRWMCIDCSFATVTWSSQSMLLKRGSYIIWHPVMIGDVIWFFATKYWRLAAYNTFLKKIWYLRDKPTEPIEKLNDFLIEYVYSLLKY